MNDLSPLRLWVMRLAFVLLALVNLFFHLLPLETTPRSWASPDLLLGFALAWSMRRPEYVPAISLTLVFLLTDLLLQRPPGLWALLALVACENLKSRSRSIRDATFGAEWIAVATRLIAIMLGYRIVLGLTLVAPPPWQLSLIETGMTILFYPLIVVTTHALMGVRKAAPGELDALGQRA
ncbi:rod shape-determining protein MreD [Sulfitobacter sp. S190]|uniref:rod shape-determining protein MreD n=1 Tax=Sulfitobacter sp. S190 TaxID=2867022 RepID=UPI0021A7DDDE|nr:rod shape-determining protein MreD [Sulfitobacter sp. S190]UWR22084.1 rod shape-determining protein MreD [Sulfitobacter sp. S190]